MEQLEEKVFFFFKWLVGGQRELNIFAFEDVLKHLQSLPISPSLESTRFQKNFTHCITKLEQSQSIFLLPLKRKKLSAKSCKSEGQLLHHFCTKAIIAVLTKQSQLRLDSHPFA